MTRSIRPSRHQPKWHHMTAQSAFDAIIIYDGFFRAKDHHEARHAYSNYDSVVVQFFSGRTEEDYRLHNDLKVAMKWFFESNITATQAAIDASVARMVAKGMVPWVPKAEALKRRAYVPGVNYK